MYALSSYQQDKAIYAVVIKSSSTKAFCAGGDVRFFYKACIVGNPDDRIQLEDFFTEEYALNHLIHRYSKPYIAVLDGIVMGGGMGISQSSVASRINIVTEHTRMAMPEVNIGLFPDVGGGYFLSRLHDEIGTYLSLTGEAIGAADALYAGLADVFIPSNELTALYATLRTVKDGDYRTQISHISEQYKERIDIQQCMLAKHKALIRHHFSAGSVKDIVTSLKQDPHPFAQKTVATMLKKSSLMLCVTLEQLRRAKSMSFADCLRMERTMMHHCFEHGDAMEGIRAAIIDKDHQPQWRPSALEGVTDKMVARFFEPVWSKNTHPLRSLM